MSPRTSSRLDEPRGSEEPREETETDGPGSGGRTESERAVETLKSVLRERDLPALAAPVAGIERQILVVRSPAGEEEPWVLLDPVVESVAREREEATEECLCLPGFRVRVPRPRDMIVRARTPGGKSVRFAAGGELARALQHQLDHLDGILPPERLDKQARSELPESLLHPPSHCGTEISADLEEGGRSGE